MSERILRWFGDRRNQNILDLTYKHLELTTEAVRELYEMVQVVGSDPSSKKELYDSINALEMEADQIRRNMVTLLSERDVFPDERDDLIEMVRAVDWIADWAKEAGRILLIVPFSKLPEDFRKSVEDMCRENFNCVKVLSDCIRELSKDPRKSLELADEVEIFEENVDELYAIARTHYVKIENDWITRGQMILVNEFLDAVETVSDWCENTADIVRAIAVRQVRH